MLSMWLHYWLRKIWISTFISHPFSSWELSVLWRLSIIALPNQLSLTKHNLRTIYFVPCLTLSVIWSTYGTQCIEAFKALPLKGFISMLISWWHASMRGWLWWKVCSDGWISDIWVINEKSKYITSTNFCTGTAADIA